MGITIAVYKCHPLKITFSYKNSFQYQKCFIEDKIIDILKIYSEKIFKNINDLYFYYDNIPIPIELKSQYTFIQLIDNNDFYSNYYLNTNYSSFKIIKDEILITVKDKKKITSYTRTHLNEPCFNEEKKILFKKIGIAINYYIASRNSLFNLFFWNP